MTMEQAMRIVEDKVKLECECTPIFKTDEYIRGAMYFDCTDQWYEGFFTISTKGVITLQINDITPGTFWYYVHEYRDGVWRELKSDGWGTE